MGVLLDSLHSALALGPVAQDHLLQARQMQALSFTAHIPLVCFGIAFPVMVLLMEWWGQRTGDPLYRTIARRWSRVMIALFAIGAITGTVLSFEMGVLWPNFTATFGGVFGLGFAIEGFSFFLEAIFLGIYVYGWDRLSPRMHLLSGIPIAVTGFLGSWMVISVNAWMNHPSGFRLVAGRVVDVHPWKALFGNDFLWHELIHMYIAAYLVTGFVMAGVYAAARLRGRWTRYERAAIVLPLMIAALAAPIQFLAGDWAARTISRDEPTKLAAIEGLAKTTKGAPLHVLGLYEHGQVRYGVRVPKALSVLAFHDPSARVQGLDAVPPSEPSAGQRRPRLLPDDGRHRHDAGDPRHPHRGRARAPTAVAHPAGVLRGRRGRGPAVRGRARGRLGHDRGRPPALGRLRSDAHQRRGHRSGRHPGQLRRAVGALRRGGRGHRVDPPSPRAHAGRDARSAGHGPRLR